MSPRIDHVVGMVLVVLLAAVAPGIAGATGESSGELVVGVDQSGENVAVTITQNGSAVENASVTVEAANVAYAGEGSYATDANGTVGLPVPTHNVTVTITAAKGNQSTAATVDLVGVQDDGELSVALDQFNSDVTVTVTDGASAVENASVTVAALNNGSYAGEGAYTTDANGTVSLSAPAENVTVEVTATKDNATGSITAELVAVEEEREFDSFGQRVAWFVQNLIGGGEGGIGDAVSDYVTSNNPGSDNKPDHAGKSDASSANKSNGGGPPEHAKNDKNGNGK